MDASCCCESSVTYNVYVSSFSVLVNWFITLVINLLGLRIFNDLIGLSILEALVCALVYSNICFFIYLIGP